MEFHSLGLMPLVINVERIDDGDGIDATMIRHQECWHSLKFNQTKLGRLNEKLALK